jgi:hypothetical protein
VIDVASRQIGDSAGEKWRPAKDVSNRQAVRKRRRGPVTKFSPILSHVVSARKIMQDDPQAYWINANRCLRRAKGSMDHATKRALTDLAENWFTLAGQIERGKPKLRRSVPALERRYESTSYVYIHRSDHVFLNEKFPVSRNSTYKKSLIGFEIFPVPICREFGCKPLNSPADEAQKLQRTVEFREIPCIFPCYP